MKYYDSKGLEVEINETDGGHQEAFVVSANYIDSGLEVSDTELDWLTDRYFDKISDDEYQKLVMAAEYAFEGDR